MRRCAASQKIRNASRLRTRSLVSQKENGAPMTARGQKAVGMRDPGLLNGLRHTGAEKD
jgi:hypothetical protein